MLWCLGIWIFFIFCKLFGILCLIMSKFQYLSNAEERLKWQANSLPTDELCTENAIILRRFNRYPLIVDPSGQASEFIMNEYRDRKITKTRSVACPISVFVMLQIQFALTHSRFTVRGPAYSRILLPKFFCNFGNFMNSLGHFLQKNAHIHPNW